VDQKAIHRNSVLSPMKFLMRFSQNSMVPCKVTGVDNVVDLPSRCVRVECSNILSPLSLPSRSYFSSLLPSHLISSLIPLLSLISPSLSSHLISNLSPPFSLTSTLLMRTPPPHAEYMSVRTRQQQHGQ
jgi:hypothetical protein